MTAPNVVQLPRPPVAIAELEGRIVGAALNLGLTLSEFEAIGIAGEDFSVELHRKAWLIARKRAERREPVTAETVGSAGLRGGWFQGDQVNELEHLALASTLTLEAFRLSAGDLRTMVRGQRLAAQLEQEARAIRGGQWNPGRTAQHLEGLASQLHRDTAPDEDASGDVVELRLNWNEAEATGKSLLLPTRINVLDAEIGGLPPGVTVIASKGGVGKTGVLDSMILAQLEADPELHLGFFGLEDGTNHIIRRALAYRTGMLLREVGWKERSEDQRKLFDEWSERYQALLTRLHVYRHDTISAAELVTRAVSWRAKYGVRGVYVDNLTEVDVSTQRFGEKEHQQIAELGRRLRNFALRERIPVVLLAHTVGTVRDGDVPTTEEIAGGQALGRRTRLFLGLWQKGEEIRCTTGKANELGPRGVTVSFARYATAGLIDPKNGEKINLQAERAAERAVKAKEKLLDQVQAAIAKKALTDEARAKAKTAEVAAEVKRDEAQQSLGSDEWLLASGDKRGPRAE